MKSVVACLIVLIFVANGQTFPGYTLSQYQSSKCNGNPSCIAQFPVYIYLTWAPYRGSQLSDPLFWTWSVIGSSNTVISCQKDYFPDPASGYVLCSKHTPEFTGEYCASSL